MYLLRVYDGDNLLDTFDGYGHLDAAETDAAWHVNHDGATKVEIVADDGRVVDTFPGKRRAHV